MWHWITETVYKSPAIPPRSSKQRSSGQSQSLSAPLDDGRGWRYQLFIGAFSRDRRVLVCRRQLCWKECITSAARGRRILNLKFTIHRSYAVSRIMCRFWCTGRVHVTHSWSRMKRGADRNCENCAHVLYMCLNERCGGPHILCSWCEEGFVVYFPPLPPHHRKNTTSTGLLGQLMKFQEKDHAPAPFYPSLKNLGVWQGISESARKFLFEAAK